VLSKLAYLGCAAPCRRWCCSPAATPPKTLRSWCFATSSPSCAARPPTKVGARRPGAARRGQPRPAQVPPVLLPRQARHAAALAPAPWRAGLGHRDPYHAAPPGARPDTTASQRRLAALLRQQAAGIVACDFLLSVDTVWLKRLQVLCFIELDTRWVQLAGVTANPNGSWVTSRPVTCCWWWGSQADRCACLSATTTRNSPGASTRGSAQRLARCW
jgi:hypothetical protein